jgi:hypothetical protein
MHELADDDEEKEKMCDAALMRLAAGTDMPRLQMG